MKQLQVKMEDKIHNNFKSKAAKEGTTMSKLIIGWIKQYLKSGN